MSASELVMHYDFAILGTPRGRSWSSVPGERRRSRLIVLIRSFQMRFIHGFDSYQSFSNSARRTSFRLLWINTKILSPPSVTTCQPSGV
jgi:hypothetical protein